MQVPLLRANIIKHIYQGKVIKKRWGRGKGRHAFLGCPEQVPRPPRGAVGPGIRGPQPAPPLSPLAAVGGGWGQGQRQTPSPSCPLSSWLKGHKGRSRQGSEGQGAQR